MTEEETISKLNAEIRTIRAQWIGMKDENDSLMTQIEYLNKAAKEDHDKIKQLEFELKQERNKAWNEAVEACQRKVVLYPGLPTILEK